MNLIKIFYKNTRVKTLVIILFLIPAFAFTQDSFGFGETESGFGFETTSKLSVNISGEVEAGFTVFIDDFNSGDEIKNTRLGDIFLGSLNFEASNSSAEGVIKLKLRPVFDGTSPLEIDEAYLRAFFGSLTLEGGLRKLSWGKADSYGPLDVINPIDYRDLTKLSDQASVKMARPMLHAAFALSSFSKIEAVFVPWFQGNKFALQGRWAPSQILLLSQLIKVEEHYVDSNKTLEYAQAGARFTTSFGSSDFGMQYYYGRLNRPRVSMGPTGLSMDYNAYHQIGLDFARVIAGFNLRAEAGANITKDLDGADPEIENPALVWSLGFDKELFSVNVNIQGNGKVRLFNGKIKDGTADCEAGTDLSSARITGIISKKSFVMNGK